MTSRQRFTATALGVLAGLVATAGVLAVVTAAFALSFDAIRDVARAAHIRPDWAWMYPVSVDGAMSTAAVCGVVLRRMGRRNVYPWAVVIVGAGISVVCNALHAYVGAGGIELPAQWAMGVSSVPPLLLAMSVHLLVILAEAVRQSTTPLPTSRNALSAAERRQNRPTQPRTPARSRKQGTGERVAAAAARMEAPTAAKLAAKLGISERTVQRHWSPPPVQTASANGGGSR